MSNNFEKDLENYRVLIYGVASNNSIKERIAPIYTEEKLAEGVDLFESTRTIVDKQKVEQAESMAVTRQFNEKVDYVQEQYVRLRKAIRYFCKSDLTLMDKLGLNIPVPKNYPEWHTLVRMTLAGLDNAAWVLDKIVIVGFTAEALIALKQELTEVEQLRLVAEKEDGEAQQATAQKNLLYDQLRHYCYDLKECLDLFYHGTERQKLEEVGIVVK